MPTVPGERIHTGSQQKLPAGILRCAEKLVNVALAICDVHAASGVGQQPHGLLQIIETANALLLFDRYPSGLIFFSASAPLNFLRDQNLIAVSPRGSPSVVTARLECIGIPHPV
jgi:hypothetical protein